MKKFGFAAIAASGLVAAILGLAAPAQATTATITPVDPASDNITRGVDHRSWLDAIHPDAFIPRTGAGIR